MVVFWKWTKGTTLSSPPLIVCKNDVQEWRCSWSHIWNRIIRAPIKIIDWMVLIGGCRVMKINNGIYSNWAPHLLSAGVWYPYDMKLGTWNKLKRSNVYSPAIADRAHSKKVRGHPNVKFIEYIIYRIYTRTRNDVLYLEEGGGQERGVPVQWWSSAE